MVQVSDAVKSRLPRGPRVVLVAALACWALSALVFAALPPGSAGRHVAVNAVYCAASVLVLVSVARAIWNASGWEKLFWSLLGVGLVAGFVGDIGWSYLQGPGFAAQDLSYQHAAYLISYLLLTGAMLRLVALTTKRITLITALDSLSIMLSGGTLIWYFFLGRVVAETGSEGSWAVLAVLSWPLFDAALLCLGLAALKAAPTSLSAQRIEPWRIFAFWLGPLSPAVHLALVLFWGATHPPLPAYVAVSGAVLSLYLALRVALVSFVCRRLGREREEATATPPWRCWIRRSRPPRDRVSGLPPLRRIADHHPRRGRAQTERVPAPPALEVRGVLRHKDPRRPVGPARCPRPPRACGRLPDSRRGLMEPRQALGGAQRVLGIPAGGRFAPPSSPRRRPWLRPRRPSPRHGPALRAPARSGPGST